MSEPRDPTTDNGAHALIPFRRPRRKPKDPDRPRRPRVKKLRLALILAGLGLLAMVSTAFGMMMAVASDLPKLEEREQFRSARNSTLLDVHGKPLGILTGPKNVVLVDSAHVPLIMRHAIIAIEDRRFEQNQGIDIKGMARALWADLVAQKAVQGASTITQQFVKNALAAQGNRTILEKLREAALAYHLTRKWSKDKILTEYLNSTYFGNGAYGIESAARTYFAKQHPGCGQSKDDPFCVSDLRPHEAALLGGIVASPSAFDPIAHPVAATARRNVVLGQMLDQGYITRPEFDAARREAIPSQGDITPPQEKTRYPYFTSWARQQIVNRFGGTRAFTGGLTIRTSLDLELQQAAQKAVDGWLSGPGQHPSAALVALDNHTGEVRALVGGRDYAKEPFNLATQGQRQPGSSFKPFTLAAALQKGYSPDSTWSSRRKVFHIPNTRPPESFVVNNFGNEYSGSTTLRDAMTVSDNSVYAEVGIKVGVPRIARLAERLGIRTPVSHNYAATLGGLKQGVTPLDMAHAYQSFATGGRLVSDPSIAGDGRGPVGVHEVRDANGKVILRDEPQSRRVLPPGVASNVSEVLQTVVQSGTARAAALPGFAAGKTGTTENYGDAWFVGWNERYTVAVWVGYPQQLKSMKTDFRGGPVEGGTFPALIWHDFMTEAMSIFEARHPDLAPPAPTGPTGPETTPTAPAPTTTVPTAPTGPTGPAVTTPQSAPVTPTPAPAQPVAPQRSTPPATRTPPRTVTPQGGGATGPG